MALWEQLLAQKAQPVDTERNPDFDSAFGLQESADDDGPTSFVKGLQSSLLRNSPQGHELTMEMAKMKMANQLQLNLEKQKLELARQYPTYEYHVGPFGVVTASNKYDPNDTRTTYPQGVNADMVAQQYATANAKNKAEQAKAETEAKPEYQNAQIQEALLKPQNVQSEIDYRKGAMTDLAEQRKARLAQQMANPSGGGGTALGESEIEKRALQDVRGLPEAQGKLYGTPQDTFMIQSDPDLAKKYQERIEYWRGQTHKSAASSGGGLLGGQPQAGANISDQVNSALTVDPSLVGLPTYGQ